MSVESGKDGLIYKKFTIGYQDLLRKSGFMNANRLLKLMAFIAIGIEFVCLISAMGGADVSSLDARGQGPVWYSSDKPEDSSQLEEKGAASSAPDDSRLQIVDLSGGQSNASLVMPSGAWAKLELIPKESGDLELLCLYPTGSVASLLNTSVVEGKVYNGWYQAELEGDYELWFSVSGSKSNSVKIAVRQSSETWDGSARAAGGGIGQKATVSAPVMYNVAPAAESAPIGFSAGGAKDINSFRENIKQDYLPLPSDLTYEGLYYDYYFDTGSVQECKKLFCPSYSFAVSRDPFSSQPQYYLTVGLNSGIVDFQRKKLNLVVVLDYSGSMSSSFDEYYYDRFGNLVRPKEEGSEQKKTKMQIADESVVALLDQLEPEDSFGLVIFSDDAYTLDPMTRMADKDLDRLKSRILDIDDYSGTNMEAGMEKGTALFSRRASANKSEYENRIIFLTDAMPNIGETGDLGLYRMLEDNAGQGIYTTIIGIGVDFNSELAESITKIKGANYYSVHSATEFQERMDDEFDFMVTPLVFDLRLKLDAPGYEIEKVYGSPEADLATGELMKVNTLFPSRSEAGEVKGGVVLVKLRKLTDEGNLTLNVSYQDREGRTDGDEAVVDFSTGGEGNSEGVNWAERADFYENGGIRKAILLSRYADLLKNWMIDERTAAEKGWQIVPSVTKDRGIVVPVDLGEWERQSMPLTVSGPYSELFSLFKGYMQSEAQAIGDETLQQELEILEKLEGYEGPDRKE
jgi:Ca-activated chloride channel family protein